MKEFSKGIGGIENFLEDFAEVTDIRHSLKHRIVGKCWE